MKKHLMICILFLFFFAQLAKTHLCARAEVKTACYTIDPAKFKRFVKQNRITHVIISSRRCPGRSLDVSAGADGSVRCWRRGRKMYVSTNKKGQKPAVADTALADKKIFFNLETVKHIDVSHLDTSMVCDMSLFFAFNDNLMSIKGLGRLDTRRVKTMSGMFQGNKSLRTVDVTNLRVGNVSDMSMMFCGNKNLVSIKGLDTWNTKNLVNMSSMFACGDSCTGNAKLADLDVTNFDTGKVRYMDDLFYGCGKIKALDLSGWDTSRVTTLDHAFCNLFSLEYLNVSTWDVSSCKDFNACFHYLFSLKFLDVSKWDTSSAIYMCQMFEGSYNLKFLDLRSFDTSNCRGFSQMFSGLRSLTELDLTSFSSRSVPDAVIQGTGDYWRCDSGCEDMFKGCASLRKIYVSENFSLAGKPHKNAFHDCKAKHLTIMKKREGDF